MKITAIRFDHRDNKTYVSIWRKPQIRKEYLASQNSLRILCNLIYAKGLTPYINVAHNYMFVTYYPRNKKVN